MGRHDPTAPSLSDILQNNGGYLPGFVPRTVIVRRQRDGPQPGSASIYYYTGTGAVSRAIVLGEHLSMSVRVDLEAAALNKKVDIIPALNTPLSVIKGGNGNTEPGNRATDCRCGQSKELLPNKAAHPRPCAPDPTSCPDNAALTACVVVAQLCNTCPIACPSLMVSI